MLPIFEFDMNNAVHASTGYTPFYVNGLTHPRVPLTLLLRGSRLGGGEVSDRLADISPYTVQKQDSAFLTTRLKTYDMCVPQQLIAKTNRSTKQMLKADAVLKVIRLVTKSY